jgi:hypothetical protein
MLKRCLPELAVSTVQEMGWSGTKNGALLRLAEEHFDVFITTDKNLRYQQNLSGRHLAFILLPSNQVPIVAALAPAVEQAVQTIMPGDFIEIPFS